ncbi:MAG: fructosamine kinase family protein [Candidatus Sedimenticola sp. 6PFRAG7]
MIDWQAIATHIGAATGKHFEPDSPGNIGGGCINSAIRLADTERSFFVKYNSASLQEMFTAEEAGLDEMAHAGAIRVPKPICSGIAGPYAYLVLEYIPMGGRSDPAAAGRQLAEMHGKEQPYFGWSMDNTIGSTPQPNTPGDNWIEFWRDQRLGFQLGLAADNGYGGRLQRRGELLLGNFPALIDHNPVPALIHGDLWGGNIGYDNSGAPVIFDPATYYGDREAELAMTELFGGFSGDFYSAYREATPIDPGYSSRKTLYNLYHVLNHANMFGGGYASQAQGMIDRLLAELGH